jgi:phosphoribosylanthranilate isomerase
MRTEVKICGLSDEAGVDAALEAGADFVGFVFFPPSPRNVSLARAAALARRARGKARLVALSVDAEDALLAAIAEALRPDLLQLHGRESAERLGAIGALTRRPVMKALGIAAAADLSAASGYAKAERLLLDAKPPREASRPGGNGAAFDWSLLAAFTPGKPWFLSGGLGPGNIADALAATGAPAVDVSSGVESAPGRKDPELIHAFVTAVRAFDAAAVAPLQRAAV